MSKCEGKSCNGRPYFLGKYCERHAQRYVGKLLREARKLQMLINFHRVMSLSHSVSVSNDKVVTSVEEDH